MSLLNLKGNQPQGTNLKPPGHVAEAQASHTAAFTCTYI